MASPTRRLPRAARREALLEAATRTFAHAGYAATSIAEVAEVAGVTPLIVYRHFETKEGLYRAVLERVGTRLAAGFPTTVRTRSFGIGAAGTLALARDDPDGFRVFWRHAAREPEFAPLVDAVRARAVAASVAAFGDRVPPRERAWAARAVVGYVVEAVLTWLEEGDPAHDERFTRATDAAMRAGVRAWSRPV